MFKYALLIILAAGPVAQAASSRFCQASAGISAALSQAASHPVVNPEDFDHNIQPFLALRQRFPDDLFAQEGYQDAVREFGIEGHYRALTEDYQGLLAQHPDELLYGYLYFRSLIGRSTPAAAQGFAQIAAENPQFAPAHRMLAEIYGSEAFGDAGKQAAERQAFLQLCPGGALARLPDAMPGPSPLLGQAETLLSQDGDSAAIVKLALQGIRDDEWRLQRIRPVDWYSVDFKRRAQQDLQSEYWRLWALQVRCWRRSNQPERANQMLATLEQRVTLLPRTPRDPQYWEALAALVHLYAEGKQMDQASQKLDEMRQFLARYPDAGRTAQLADLRKLVPGQTTSSTQ
ncbi:MAG TPA: hypothetical protein VLV49_14290 [Terriglobales bacterium]|nr:hypothetical protein [Terriglobales bacterium]